MLSKKNTALMFSFAAITCSAWTLISLKSAIITSVVMLLMCSAYAIVKVGNDLDEKLEEISIGKEL